ncbi:hypothetical protein ANN_01668 [Periplaneta americana]|uniref:PiggyBac transposable element-derived protein domain-containing protein n=1 Tax=Periplaneta americana TaxID=6978 RepID=A0ABQ8TU73_PERAM|nr:hypothetical protein ANN_01668 [Periplaneta americana]
MAIRWKDKKDILLSTIHNPEMVVKNVDLKPKVVTDYNDTMGGVDHVDQHLAAYPVPRKRRKRYYKKIFFHLLELALWNFYILYTKKGRS